MDKEEILTKEELKKLKKREINKRSKEKHKERYKEKQKEYDKKYLAKLTPEQKRQKRQKRQNKEKTPEQKEKLRLYMSEYIKKNPEKVLKIRQKYYQKLKDLNVKKLSLLE